MAVTVYLRELDPAARKRHYHETRRGEVVRFVVQLELLFGRVWIPILRYDMAHGAPHVDRYETPTRKTTHRLDLSPKDALAQADEEVNRHWMRHRDRFLRRNRP